MESNLTIFMSDEIGRWHGLVCEILVQICESVEVCGILWYLSIYSQALASPAYADLLQNSPIDLAAASLQAPPICAEC